MFVCVLAGGEGRAEGGYCKLKGTGQLGAQATGALGVEHVAAESALRRNDACGCGSGEWSKGM